MASERKKLLIVGLSKNQGYRCIKQAKRRNLHISILETEQFFNNNSNVTREADTLIPIPDKNVPKIQTWLASGNLVGDFDYIFTFDELSVEVTALIAKYLGLIANTQEAIATIKDKYKLRNALSQAGFKQPAIQKCSTIEEAISFFKQETNGLAVMKPRIGLGSEGVSLVRSENDIMSAYQNLSKYDKTAFLIESFIIGSEYSIEGVFVENQPIFFGITEKQLLNNGTFVEGGHIFPAPLINETERKIFITAKKALNVIGLTKGLFHIELWVTEDKANNIVLGEIHARPGGDFIHWLTELSTGIETYGSAIDDLIGKEALDKSLLQENISRKIVGIQYLQISSGKLVNIASVSDVRNMQSCIYLHCPLSVGDIIRPIQNWKEREKIGYIIATGKSYHDLKFNIAQIQNALAIKIVPI